MVGADDATTGQAIIAYVTLRSSAEADGDHGEVLRNHVAKEIGAIAKPKTIIFTPDLPKTRSGKIMRRLLRDVAEGRDARRHHHAGRRHGGRRDPHPRPPRPRRRSRPRRAPGEVTPAAL